ncbi:hypothetical protein BDL97_10G066900 [Sphagnum fallax]|nr:hypothetical protein BDL97_10G066900 [Sphagnum fallax]KAH8950108.1 hypothetical protein BDL97_10G066900 [Sphagnum fallax]
MVATKRSSTHVEFNPKQKGGGAGAGAGGGSSSSSSVVSEGGAAASLIEPLGGFIFVCNNDTMDEDFERHLFGLPQRYQDTVRAIQPGLPLFLYNYSTRCLHGVFEASSDGGLNLEPGAWENKDTRKSGRQQSSRFPAQVRVRWREQKPPLEEETFRPLLYHYDGPKFRLELSKAEADDLLKLFGMTSHHHQEMVEAEEDFGGEWEKVKSKSKLTRINRPPPSKRSTSPNSPAAGRKRWGPLANGSTTTTSTAGASHSSHNPPVHGDAFIHGRESRADIAQRWRSDSDSWSGSSSAGFEGGDGGHIASTIVSAAGSNRASSSSTGVQGKQEQKEDVVIGEGEVKRGDKVPAAWSNSKSTLAARLAGAETGSAPSGRLHGTCKSVANVGSVDSNIARKKIEEDGCRNRLQESERRVDRCGGSSPQARQAIVGARDNTSKPLDTASRTVAWQGNDAAVLRRLHEPLLAVSGNSLMNGSSSGHPSSPHLDAVKTKPVVVATAAPLQLWAPLAVAADSKQNAQTTMSDELMQSAWPVDVLAEVPQPSAVLPSPKGLHSRKGAQTPPFQPSRPVHEPWRGQQNDQLKQEEQAEEKVHAQNVQSHQYRQLGQNLMPLRIPTPTPSSLQQQQHHRHPPVSPAHSNTYYRDRAQARMRTGASSVDAGPHLVAYRPISRVPPDGGTGFQNGYIQGGWGFPSPVPLLTPMSPIGDDGLFALPPPQLLGNVDILHMEIAEFAVIARPSPDARICAEAAVDCVREGVKQLWPGADVEVFGSFATGLCLPHSDVDVVVVDSPPLPDTPETAALSGARALAPLIRVLGTALRGYEWCESLNTIDSASMPVIKLRCRPSIKSVEGCQPTSPPTSVAIDITIGGRKTGSPGGRSQEAAERPGGSGGGESLQIIAKFEAATKSHNGAAAREYVIERLRQFPALAPLVLLLKSYLHQRGLNDVYTGGLGSFSLTLMLVFYLERAPVSCGISQGSLRPQEAPPPPPSESALASSSVSLLPPSKPPVDCSLASVSSGTDSLDSFDEGASYSSGSTDTTTSASTRTSASSSSSSSSCCSETSLSHGGTPITINSSTPVLSSSGEPAIRRAGGIVEELLISMQSVPPPNLGLLLIGFLQSFGREIDFSHVRLVLKGRNGTGGGLFWADKVSRPMTLCIDDPLRPGANIGAGSFNIFHVQVAMQDMLQMLTRSLGVTSSERVDNTDPSCRRPLRLLDQLFVMDNLSAVTQ